jgi:MOSC domain-containing protein YiiM
MKGEFSPGVVIAVCLSAVHQFSKPEQKSIRLLVGLGVEGDAHLGVTVQHRSRVAKDPSQPNLRQVHLIHEELIGDLRACGFQVAPGSLGENITTRGVDLLALPRGARLHIGNAAVVGVTGLRDPCRQLNDYQSGLMAAVLGRDEKDNLVRKAGIMGIILTAGEVRAGDPIRVELLPDHNQRLERV